MTCKRLCNKMDCNISKLSVMDLTVTDLKSVLRSKEAPVLIRRSSVNGEGTVSYLREDYSKLKGCFRWLLQAASRKLVATPAQMQHVMRDGRRECASTTAPSSHPCAAVILSALSPSNRYSSFSRRTLSSAPALADGA